MTRCVLLAVLVLVLTGCATAPPPTATAPGQRFTGEVWNWDTQTNVVTLRQGFQTIRVQVTPDQLVGLRLHQTATIQGQLAGPAEIERVTTPPPALVARGAPEDVEITGAVVAVNPAGTATIDSARGPVTVWLASPSSGPSFQAGQQVRVRVRVQPLDAVPAGTAPPASAGPGSAAEPAASVATEPGDYAVVRGRITAVSPTGGLTVESPRGPVQVWVPSAARYAVGQWVELRTAVLPAS